MGMLHPTATRVFSNTSTNREDHHQLGSSITPVTSWCFEVGHLARSHNLPWNADIWEKWQNNKNSWHVVKALSDPGKNPSQVAAALNMELSFPKHMGKMEKLCAIAAEYAKITLEAAHAKRSKIKVTKKKKKKKKSQDENAEDAEGKQMEMDIKQEPEDEPETKRRGTAFNFKAPAPHSDMREKESRLSTTQFEVQRLSSTVSSVEIDVAHRKTDLAGVRSTVGHMKVDQSGAQAACMVSLNCRV